jgi:precorrin-2 dehydrogenase/sirohydrochlorin ferrochelatase
MKYYPISLTALETRQTVVVGGGRVAARKVDSLLQASANITVISPQAIPHLQQLQTDGQITLINRPYQPGDLCEAFLVIAATNNPGINHQVLQEARQCGCLINMVDDPAAGNFIVPAVVQRGPITLTISTGGGSPALARWLREQLEDFVGPEYGELAVLLTELRPELRQHYPDSQSRTFAVFQLIDSGLADIIKTQGLNAAGNRARQLLGLNK